MRKCFKLRGSDSELVGDGGTDGGGGVDGMTTPAVALVVMVMAMVLTGKW